MGQQSLAIQLKAPSDFASFYAGPNRLIVNTLTQLSSGDFIYIWGALGVSHLLQACCIAAESHSQRAFYLDLLSHAQISVELLIGLEDYDVIVIDHIDAIAGIEQWEQALFHLYNRTHALQHSFIVGAHSTPIDLKLHLADLSSRLNAMLVLQLKALTDTDKLILLQQRAQLLGLNLTTDVGIFLLNHTDRDLKYLLQLLRTLDQASLRAQRKLTIPFIKTILQALS